MKLARERLALLLACLLLFINVPGGFAYATNQSAASLPPAQNIAQHEDKQNWETSVRASTQSPSLLDSRFHAMYDLDFHCAQQQFAEYQEENPDDPMGPAAEAAGLLFSELNRLGVLQAQTFVKDASFKARGKLVPDAAVREKFETAIRRSQELSQKQLAGNGNDRDALFASTLAAGLKADYVALVQKRAAASLAYARQANDYAQRLLAVCPDCYDAYVATGITKYLIGVRAAPVRWVLRARGFTGDKREGINELQLAAQHGHYLAPFARILLAIAYLRDKKPEQAELLLAGLRAEFPGNMLFAQELERFGTAAAPSTKGQPHFGILQNRESACPQCLSKC
jgi:hypothetical protein